MLSDLISSFTAGVEPAVFLSSGLLVGVESIFFSCFGDAGVFVASVTDVTVDAVAALGFSVVIFVVVNIVVVLNGFSRFGG